MAALQKIRSWGPLLVGVVGLALFAFIAGDVWRIFQPQQGVQDIGSVNGEKLSAQDYQKMVEEMSDVYRISMGGQGSLGEEEQAQIKDQVWQSYVTYRLISEEAEKLGIQVTDAEMQWVINEGTHPMLLQTPFVNRQTGRFDKDALKQFLAEYEKMGKGAEAEQAQALAKYWNFIERTLRETLLAQKYQALVSKSVISNPIAAERAFADRTVEADVLLAALPYTSVADSAVKVSNDDINKLYNERKEQFKQLTETRDITYVDVKVVPSAADREAVKQDVLAATLELEGATDLANVVRSANSAVLYSSLPVNKSVLPADVALRLDSVSVGGVYPTYYNVSDDSYNSFKLVARVHQPDSIEFRQIQVVAETPEKTKALADSIYTALKGGANFEEIAQKYGQAGTANWVTAQSWEGAEISGDNLTYLQALLQQPVGELSNLPIGQINLILQVTAKKAFKDKYNVAVIKNPVRFSKDTYQEAYNKFSQFVAENTTVETLKANAQKEGYTLIPRADLSSAEHYIGGIAGTKEALRWVFGAKQNEVSALYECGDDNDHMIVVGLENINKEGYKNVAQVTNELRAEAIKNKKAELLMAQMTKAGSLAQVEKLSGAVSDTVKHITFSAPAFISVTMASEPAVNGVVAKLADGKTSAPIKGTAGVYMVQVLKKDKTEETFDAKAEQERLKASAQRFASQFIGDLYMKAKIKDKRYLYF